MPSVYNITKLSRVNFYGYHDFAIDVLEIELYKPVDVSRLAEILSTPNLLGPGIGPLKVFEVHIPYLLQFLVENGIQGVTPFLVQASRINFVQQRGTRTELEISITPDAIINLRQSSQTRAYPVPPPLAPGSDELVCEVLQQLWEEEYNRTSPGEKFPYYPEGMVDGINRPDCSEMPWVEARKDKVREWGNIIKNQEIHKTPPEEFSTQEIIKGLGEIVSFDMSLGGEDSRDVSPTQILRRADQLATASTYVQSSGTYIESSAPDEPKNIIAEPLTKNPEIKKPTLTLLPPSRCVLRYTQGPPKIKPGDEVLSTNCSQIGRMSLTGTSQAVGGPIRSGKLAPVPDHREDSDVSFCTMAIIEIICDSQRRDFKQDAILAIACILIDERDDSSRKIIFSTRTGGPFVSEKIVYRESNSEKEMIERFHSEILVKFDPSIVVSWDSYRFGLGYILNRGKIIIGANFSVGRGISPDEPNTVSGRLVIDLWRVLRKDPELKLDTTTLEGVVLSVLGLNIPSHSEKVLGDWMKDIRKINYALQFLMKKCILVNELTEVTMVMHRSTEMARLYGMDLESTFTRGSQFRVECMLVRATRRLGYILPSSSRAAVHNQREIDGLPLILEPQSGLITDPVCVFDFQSLYPSIMIAYNICYSTCLGLMTDLNQVTHLGTQPGLVRKSSDIERSIGVCSEVAFMQRRDRVGIIPRICHEILQTRIMVKKSMKTQGKDQKSKSLLKQLDARQLSLKLLANVIYGYTTANFTGRMPCSEIADSILITARESLKSVMNIAESMGGIIVYGDTDSLFVRLPNKTIQEAFDWGVVLTEEISKRYPWPMKLIHEKVYSPCCLVAKKRYVGRAYDTPTSEPRLDAKGIETIRRDTCLAVASTIERIILSVFESANSDPVHAFESSCISEFTRILKGGLPLKHFVFQNQARDPSHYKNPDNVPAAVRVALDAGRTDIQRKERIAFVITEGMAGPNRLSELVKPPSAIVSGKESLNLDYYLTKQIIPAIQRIFGPIANRAFYCLGIARNIVGSSCSYSIQNRSKFAVSRKCLVCGSPTASSIFFKSVLPLFCQHCLTNRKVQTLAIEMSKPDEIRNSKISKLCLHCVGGHADAIEECQNAYHCEVYFKRS